jgi:hypothetical protein
VVLGHVWLLKLKDLRFLDANLGVLFAADVEDALFHLLKRRLALLADLQGLIQDELSRNLVVLDVLSTYLDGQD